MGVEGACSSESVLEAYLFGLMDFDAALHMQSRFIDQVDADRDRGFLMLCEHPPQVSVGRQGSWAHIFGRDGAVRNPVRWVNRGGGCFFHQPGQIAVYSILALDRRGLSIAGYLDRLQGALATVLDDFCLKPQCDRKTRQILCSGRVIASLGIAVSGWVAYFGGILNVHSDHTGRRSNPANSIAHSLQTSIERERRGPVRSAMVRERLLEYYAARFGYERTSLFLDHPSLRRKVTLHALPAPT